jgi:hypothetical protein
MFSKTKIALAALIFLSAPFSASAATESRALYNVLPNLSTPSGAPVRDYIRDPIVAPERDQRGVARR